jgi:hypothetical protein
MPTIVGRQMLGRHAIRGDASATLQQPLNRHPDRVRDPPQDLDRHVPLRPLDLAEVARGDVNAERDLLLG